MSRGPFLRFALVVLVTLYVVGLALVNERFGQWWTLAATGFGVVGAAAFTLEVEPSPGPRDLRRRRRQPEEGTRGFERIS